MAAEATCGAADGAGMAVGILKIVGQGVGTVRCLISRLFIFMLILGIGRAAYSRIEG